MLPFVHSRPNASSQSCALRLNAVHASLDQLTQAVFGGRLFTEESAETNSEARYSKTNYALIPKSKWLKLWLVFSIDGV